MQIDYRKKITENHNINAQLGYSFTKSVNSDTQKQLMYVPLHKFFSNIGYEYKFMKLYIQECGMVKRIPHLMRVIMKH